MLRSLDGFSEFEFEFGIRIKPKPLVATKIIQSKCLWAIVYTTFAEIYVYFKMQPKKSRRLRRRRQTQTQTMKNEAGQTHFIVVFFLLNSFH